jgi:hypothetical protein
MGSIQVYPFATKLERTEALDNAADLIERRKLQLERVEVLHHYLKIAVTEAAEYEKYKNELYDFHRNN